MLSGFLRDLPSVVHTYKSRNSIKFSTMSVQTYSTSTSISSKTLLILEEITSTIKALVILSKNEDLQVLNRSLYRSMDSLVVLKCQLLQLQVSLLSSPTYSSPTLVCEDLTMTDLPISEKTSSSTSIPGKKRSRPVSPVNLTQEPSTSSLTRQETQVNLPSANTCAGITKYLCSDGVKLAIYYTSCQNSLTNLHTFLTYHDLSLQTGQKTIYPQQWKESKMGFSSTRNMNALKSL